MKQINKQLKFFITLAQAYSKVTQVFDRRLVGGLGFSNLVILYHLSQAADEKMRRIDLADKVGLTPSGVTRILLPMEKLGMVKREEDAQDARVSYVKLAAGGKRLLNETLEQAQYVAEEMLPTVDIADKKELSDIFSLFTINRIG